MTDCYGAMWSGARRRCAGVGSPAHIVLTGRRQARLKGQHPGRQVVSGTSVRAYRRRWQPVAECPAEVSGGAVLSSVDRRGVAAHAPYPTRSPCRASDGMPSLKPPMPSLACGPETPVPGRGSSAGRNSGGGWRTSADCQGRSCCRLSVNFCRLQGLGLGLLSPGQRIPQR
jgi:hypothetical protein